VLASSRLIWMILLVALLIRCGFALRTPTVEWDAESYRRVARHLADGAGYTSDGLQPETYWAPLAPFLIAGVYTLGGGNLAVREVWAVLGACLVLVLHALVRTQYGMRAANLAAVGASFYPYNIIMGASTSTEIPNIILVLLTLFFLCSLLREGRLRYSFLAGLSLGLAVLARPAGVVFLPFCAALLFWRLTRMSATRRIAAGLLFLCTAALIFAPWSIRTSKIVGEHCVVTSGGAWNLWFGNNPWMEDYLAGRIDADKLRENLRSVIPAEAATQPEKDRAVLSAMRHFILTNPAKELRLVAFKIVKFWQIPGLSAAVTTPSIKSLRWVIVFVGYAAYLPIVVLSLLSIVFYVRAGRINEIGIPVGWIALTFSSYIWFPAVTRFRFAGGVDNLMILLSAALVANAVYNLPIGLAAPVTRPDTAKLCRVVAS
jgi:4-amino-4-deoxy-L-arabinose transferase-like glycosyltransferase